MKKWLLYILGLILGAMILLFTSCSAQKSNITLPELFSNNMVLQQNSTTPIWGWALPGSKIKVKTSWGANAFAIASSEGKWKLNLQTPETDGNIQSLIVSSSDTSIILNKVLLGEVWLCSEQSNMEMPVSGWLPNDTLYNSEKEVNEANYPAIRMFTVKRNKSLTPLETCEGTWQVSNPENVSGFSATAYFFGRELHKKLNVPIGLIHSSWSGSPAESWVDVGFIEHVDGYQGIKQQIAKATDKSSPYNQWLFSMKRKSQDEFIQHEKFNLVDNCFDGIMNAYFDDSAWDIVSTSSMDKVFQLDDFNGMVWFRQEFTWNEDVDADNLQINLGIVDDLNAVFINGTMVGCKENWGGKNAALL